MVRPKPDQPDRLLRPCFGVKEFPVMASVTVKLLNQLEQQFAHFAHPNHNNFNSLYLSATTIDPRYCLISDKVQKQAAKCNLNYLLKVSSPAVIDTTHMDGENEKVPIR